MKNITKKINTTKYITKKGSPKVIRVSFFSEKDIITLENVIEPKTPPRAPCPKGGYHDYAMKGYCSYQCTKCKGKKTYHENYRGATCTSPAKCACGATTSGSALGHNWVSNHHAESSHPHYMVDACSRRGCDETRTTSTQASWKWTYGSWYSINDSQHKRVKTCSRCPRQSSETGSHGGWSYGNWYSVSNSQHKRTKTCGTCGYQSSETGSHSLSWGGWYEDSSAGQCKAQGKCMCGYVGAKWKSHSYSNWYYSISSDTNCKKYADCSDCGGRTYQYPSHSFGDEYFENGCKKIKCVHCGYVKVLSSCTHPTVSRKNCYTVMCVECKASWSDIQHKMGEYHYQGNCKEVATCSVCSSTASRTRHQRYSGATCISLAKCACGATTSGSYAPHDWVYKHGVESSCSSIRGHEYYDKCRVCKNESGTGVYKPGVTSWSYSVFDTTQCKKYGDCNHCGKRYYEYPNHSFDSNNTCVRCGYVSRKPAPTISDFFVSKTYNSITVDIRISGTWTGSILTLYKNGRTVYQDYNKLSLTYTGLIANSEYAIKIQVWNGNSDATSQVEWVTTLPHSGPPQITSVSASAGLNFDDSPFVLITVATKNAKAYVVNLSNGTYNRDISNSLETETFSEIFRDSNLKPDTLYTYKIIVTGEGNDVVTKTGTIRTLSNVPYVNYIEITSVTSSGVSAWVSTNGGAPSSFKWYVNESLKTTTTSPSCTITGLKGSTKYTLKCRAENRHGYHEATETFNTKQGKFYWSGGSASDGSFKSGDSFKRLTADEMNDFCTAVKVRYAEQHGGQPAMPYFSRGDNLLAVEYNQILNVMRNISGMGSLPSNVQPRQKIYADAHINALARAFNQSITTYKEVKIMPNMLEGLQIPDLEETKENYKPNYKELIISDEVFR